MERCGIKDKGNLVRHLWNLIYGPSLEPAAQAMQKKLPGIAHILVHADAADQMRIAASGMPSFADRDGAQIVVANQVDRRRRGLAVGVAEQIDGLAAKFLKLRARANDLPLQIRRQDSAAQPKVRRRVRAESDQSTRAHFDDLLRVEYVRRCRFDAMALLGRFDQATDLLLVPLLRTFHHRDSIVSPKFASTRGPGKHRLNEESDGAWKVHRAGVCE